MVCFHLQKAVDSPNRPPVLASLIPSQTPHFGLAPENSNKIKATWLGHAAFLVELPAPSGASRGARILFDPALSTRCSVVQWIGPTRYSNVPCSIEDIPAIDAIVISHNHYDHMDEDTLKLLNQLHRPHIFAPLGNDGFLESFGYSHERRHILDWWDSSRLSLNLPATSNGSDSVDIAVDITCTPAQHTANRTPTDRWRSLWSSWAITSASSKVFFGGDTGYRTVRDGENENEVPVCPAFREIGDRFGGFDLALLPIGAYAPRAMWSCLHASPTDAVDIFKDVKAKRALGMHWGISLLQYFRGAFANGVVLFRRLGPHDGTDCRASTEAERGLCESWF
jgi:N-acyl-phosphatidylethanolamine-hydrolysing phospholipase D